MEHLDVTHKEAVRSVLTAIQLRMRAGPIPFLVAIDGGSGAGKSTVAREVGARLNASVIPSDDFYAAHIPVADWDRWSPVERYREVIDWQRLRSDALIPLLQGRPARWHAFDFTQQRADGTFPLSAVWTEREPSECIIVEGAYATRPELADLPQLTILIDVPVAVRHQRLLRREDARLLAAWHARWDAVEDYYFTRIRPRSSFDLVVAG